jgi:hypothetical protein
MTTDTHDHTEVNPTSVDDAIKDIWKAYAYGNISEAQAYAQTEKLRRERDGEISARMRLRRLWGGTSSLPPDVRVRLTLGQQAVLVAILRQCKISGICSLTNSQIAGLAGCCRTLVSQAKSIARRLGLITIQERRVSLRSNMSSVIRISCSKLMEWIRRGPVGGWLQKSDKKKNIDSFFLRAATHDIPVSSGPKYADEPPSAALCHDTG